MTQQVFPIGIIPFPGAPNSSGFNLDRDSIIQGTNDRDFKFRVHFAEPLRVQGLKETFSWGKYWAVKLPKVVIFLDASDNRRRRF
jgi:hypothetical protein